MFSLSLSPVVLSQYRGGKQEAAGVPQPLACVYSAPCEIKATQKAALKWEPPLYKVYKPTIFSPFKIKFWLTMANCTEAVFLQVYTSGC